MQDYFTGVPLDELDAVWPHLEALVRGACKRSRDKMTSEAFFDAIKNRDMQLWRYGLKAVVITEIVKYPKYSACRMPVVTGRNAKEWVHNIAMIEAWARAQGCRGMELIARPGWKKVLKEYEMTHVVLEKSL